MCARQLGTSLERQRVSVRFLLSQEVHWSRAQVCLVLFVVRIDSSFRVKSRGEVCVTETDVVCA